MKPDFKDALGLALERGIAGDPKDGQWAFHNASPVPGLDEAWKQSLICGQSFRPEYLGLRNSGYHLLDEQGDGVPTTKGSIYFLGRDRKANEYNLTNIWNRLSDGARLVVAGNKNDGIASIRKWFGAQVDLVDSYSKYHSVVFWADKKSSNQELPALETLKEIEGYAVRDGIFSSDGPDKGSQLLVEHFDKRVKGRVADLGAGWGYLSSELLQKSDRVESIDLFEADLNALNLSEKNVGRFADGRASYSWIDVTSEFPKKPYHWVIMNPPFHSGRAADPELGKKFISVAASTLPSGGRLLMVANRNLPYEQVLASKFKRFEKLEERDGFKVIEAVK